MKTRGFGWGSAYSALGAGAAMLAALFAALFLIAQRANIEAQSHEQRQVQNGLRQWVADLQDRIAGQTDWDDALKSLGVKYDPVWAHANIGQFMGQMMDLDRVYVLDASDKPIYAMEDGQDVAARRYASVEVDARSLLVQVRRAELARPVRVGKPPYRELLSKPIQFSKVTVVDGRPIILTASLVQTDFGRVTLRGSAPVVVSAEPLDGEFLERFSNRFLLKNLHIHAGDVPGRENGESSLGIDNGDNRKRVQLDWTAVRPGDRLLVQALPPVTAVICLFAAWAAMIFRRGRRSAQALIASESQSKHMAFHDGLTGLPNRSLFNERIGQTLAALRRNEGCVGLLVLDLDRFKEVNDTHGHAAGDELICLVAQRLSKVSRSTDTVVRFGGDEFAILQPQSSVKGLSALAERIVSELSEPIDLACGRVYVGASVGMTIVESADVDAGEVLRQADLAMYRAKAEGRGRYAFFEPEMDHSLKARKALEGDLREAIAEGQLSMVYQPQADASGKVVGLEALVRWTHPKRGSVSPAFFIPVAEECGLIDQIGEFTLRQAFRDSLRWPDLTMAVNVSAAQVRDAGLPRRLAAILRETGASASQIELEITEGVLLADDEMTHATLERLREMGFSLALDDFGTGYSSLAYLRRYPVDKIKIDRSFLVNLGTEEEAGAVVGAIVKLAKALNLKVIAEGVETDVQREGLRRAGCRHIQGFLFSKPIPADAISVLLGRAPVSRAA